MRCLWLSWSLTVWLAAILTSAGTLLPYWLSGRLQVDKVVSADLGLFRRCGYPIYSHLNISEKVLVSHGCGHYPSLTSIPHIAWRISIIFLCLACAILFFLTFFLFFSGFNQSILATPRIYKSCQFFQILSGIMILVACVIYPFGWHDNSEVRQVCGETADYFYYGECQIGWAMVVTILGGCISVLGAMIPKFLMKPKAALDSPTTDPMNKFFPNTHPIMNANNLNYQMHVGQGPSYYFNPGCDSSSLLIDSAMTSPLMIHSPKMGQHSRMLPCSPKMTRAFDQISTNDMMLGYPGNPYSPQMSIRNGHFAMETPNSYRRFKNDSEVIKTPQLSRHYERMANDPASSPYFSSPNRATNMAHGTGSIRNCRPYIETLDEVEYEQKTLHNKEDSGVSGSKESGSEEKSDSTSLGKEILTDKS